MIFTKAALRKLALCAVSDAVFRREMHGKLNEGMRTLQQLWPHLPTMTYEKHKRTIEIAEDIAQIRAVMSMVDDFVANKQQP